MSIGLRQTLYYCTALLSTVYEWFPTCGSRPHVGSGGSRNFVLGELDGSYKIIGGANNLPAVHKLTTGWVQIKNCRRSRALPCKLLGELHLSKKHLLGELNYLSLYIASHFTIFIGGANGGTNYWYWAGVKPISFKSELQ